MINFIKYINIKNFVSSVKYYSIKLYEKFERDHIWVLTSGIAFNILLSIIPFLLIALTILGIYLNSSDTLQRINEYLFNILPMQDVFKEKFITTLSERAKELTSNTFLTGVIGFIALIWTMSGLFSTMRDVLNKIYSFDGYVNFFRGKIRDFILVIVTLVLFVITLSITSFFQIFDSISNEVFGVTIMSNLFINNKYLLPIIVSMITSYLMFYILYKFIPQFDLPSVVLKITTILSAILFEIAKYIYTLYVLKLSSFQRIYGTYAFIVISIFWIYYISLIYCTSAVIGQIYLEKNDLKITFKKKQKNGTKKTIQDD